MLLMSAILASCHKVLPEKDTVYDCDAFEVYTDSIIRGSKIYKALSHTEITNAWHTDSVDPALPSYRSPQLMADALFCKAMHESAYFTPLQIYLSLAALQPAKSMEALRALVVKGRVARTDFPITASNGAWAAAAWEIYCVTGDRKWLREAYDVLISTLRHDQQVNISSQPPLVFGAPDYLAPIADYYPGWMKPIDRFQTISTGVNALHTYTYDVLSEMASELGLKDAADYKKTANSLRGAINDLLWIPNLGYYGQYMYGTYYPILSQATDQIANSLCVLFDIATPEMATSIVARSPMLPQGTPLVYPSINTPKTSSPLVQALRGISAAKTRNENAVIASIGSLWNIALDHPIPAESQAMVLKGLLGMQFTSKGITFAPIIPYHFTGKKTLHNFHYRDAELSISVQGTGDKIAGFFIDSISTSPAFIPASITGKHQIDITLSGNNLPLNQISMVEPVTLPTVPDVKWTLPGTATIKNFKSGYSYGVYINGTFLEEIQTASYSYTPTAPTVVTITPIAEQEYVGFASRSHVIALEGTEINIPASSITPRRTPLHLIKHRETATKYIELAARHNTRITFYANAPEEGEYFINIGYSNGTGETAMRTLSVNGTDCGLLVCPSLDRNDWVTVHPSNTLTVKLNEGPNQLALTYINTTVLLNKITLLKK